jgi:hypothetical protein
MQMGLYALDSRIVNVTTLGTTNYHNYMTPLNSAYFTPTPAMIKRRLCGGGTFGKMRRLNHGGA